MSSPSLSKCMEKGCNAPPEHECIWADGRARAWYCNTHYGPWKKKADKGEDGEGGWLELVKERKVKGGAVGKKYGEDPKPKAASVAQRKQAADAHAKSIALMGFLSKVAQRLGVAKNVYVVGGAVRNFIIDQPIKDIDVVIDAVALGGQKDSDWFAKKLSQAIPTSTNVVTNQYGVAILTVKGPWDLDGNDLRGEVIEIANARSESYGGEAGKGYKPDEVIPATIEEDVYRREFTFNTLLWSLLDLANGPEKAEIIDLTGCGLRDLENRELKCPRDPDVVFADDPTRLMRAIKFVAKYGFKIPPDLAASIKRNAPKMKQAPWEAIGNLLVGNVLNEPTAAKALKLMKSLGLLDVVAEMVQEQKPFAAYLAGQLKDRKVALLLDLMDLGLDVRSPITFLTREQQERLRQVTTPMPEGKAEEYLGRLKKVPLNNMALIQEFDIPKQERGVLSTKARDMMLADPDLAFSPSDLQGAMEKELGRVYRTSKTAAPEKYSHIDFKPPASVANAAKQGLEYRQKASPSNKGGLTSEEAGKAGIGSGVQRAVNLKNRDEASPETIRKMHGFFSRHEKNKSIAPENKGTPWNDKGYVAWLLWGGDPGQSWAQKVMRQMEAADEKAKAKKASDNEPTNQKLWDKVIRLTKGEVKSISHDGKTIEGPNDGKGFDIYPSAYCVPMNSEALTEEGWRTFGELRVGDRVLAYDRVRDVLDWTPIEDLHFHPKAPTVRLKKQSLDVVCTPEHRWLHFRSSIHTKHPGDMEALWSTLQAVQQGQRKVSHVLRDEIPGFQHWWDTYRHCESFDEFFLESGRGGTSLVPTSEMSLEGKLLVSAPYVGGDNTDWRFRQKYRGSWLGKLMSMSPEALESFYAACVMCDGWQLGTTDNHGFSQKDPHHADAFELCAFLTGRRVRRRFDPERGLSIFTTNAKRYIPLPGTKVEPEAEQPVWCPETKFGTWVMRQNGHVLITGNSNGWAAKTYKSLGGGWKKESALTAAWGPTLDEEARVAKGKAKKDVGKGGLDEWFSGHGGDKGEARWGDWVSISPVSKTLPSGKKVEKGDIVGPCGISDDPDWKEFTNGGKDPLKCMPRQKAHDMPKAERAEKAEVKMRAEKKDDSKGKKPTRTPTFKDDKKDKKADADGSYMTVQNLQGLVEHSSDLLEKIDTDTPLDDWVESLVSQAATKVVSVYEYMEHGKGQDLTAAWGSTLTAKEQIPGGLAQGMKPSDFDPKQLEMGTQVEHEHLEGDGYSAAELKAKAQEIAMDHLAEIPDYYTRLKKMEDEAEKKEARGLTAAWGDTIEDAARVKVKTARTYNRIVMFDFDGTLFRSWEATPDWWEGTSLDTGPYSFFVQPESLDVPCVPDNPGSVYWVQKPLSEAKKAISDRGTLTVLITGRVGVHKKRVQELAGQKGLRFDHYYFNPGMAAARFKIVVLKNLLVGYNTIDTVEIWENENQKTYDSAMKATAKALAETRGEVIDVKVHHVHVPPKELECGPEDFNLPSQNQPQSEARMAFDPSEQRFETLAEWGTRLAGGKTAAVTGDGTGVGFFIPIPPNLAEQFPSREPHDDSPAHITFMYVGDIPADQQDHFLAISREAFSQLEGPVRAVLDGVDIFQQQEMRVAYSRVRFTEDIAKAHDLVRRRLEANGIDVAHSFPYLTPHATLAYMGPHDVWEGQAPEGTWSFDRIQVWGLPKLEEIGFGEEIVNLPDDPELGPRKFARLTAKRANFARLAHAWGTLDP